VIWDGGCLDQSKLGTNRSVTGKIWIRSRSDEIHNHDVFIPSIFLLPSMQSMPSYHFTKYIANHIQAASASLSLSIASMPSIILFQLQK
jgi:hypothetical protein